MGSTFDAGTTPSTPYLDKYALLENGIFDGAECAVGLVGENGVYRGVLSDANRNTLSDYLMTKWGIKPSITVTRSTTWDTLQRVAAGLGSTINGTFETTIDPWYVAGTPLGQTLTRDTTQFHSGVASMKLVGAVNTGNQWSEAAIDRYEVMPQGQKACVFWAKAAAPQTIQVWAYWGSAPGDWPESSMSLVSITTSWQQYTVIWDQDLPAFTGIYFDQVPDGVIYGGGGGSANTLWLDDLTIGPADTASPSTTWDTLQNVSPLTRATTWNIQRLSAQINRSTTWDTLQVVGYIPPLAADDFIAADNPTGIWNGTSQRSTPIGNLPWVAGGGALWGINAGWAVSTVSDGNITVDPGTTDGVLEATFWSGLGAQAWSGFTIRRTDGSNQLRFFAPGYWMFAKFVAGAQTYDVAAGGVVTPNTTYRVRVAMNGPTIDLYVDNAFVLSYTITDPVLLTGRRVGFVQTTTGAADSAWKSFAFRALPVAPVTTLTRNATWDSRRETVVFGGRSTSWRVRQAVTPTKTTTWDTTFAILRTRPTTWDSTARGHQGAVLHHLEDPPGRHPDPLHNVERGSTSRPGPDQQGQHHLEGPGAHHQGTRPDHVEGPAGRGGHPQHHLGRPGPGDCGHPVDDVGLAALGHPVHPLDDVGRHLPGRPGPQHHLGRALRPDGHQGQQHLARPSRPSCGRGPPPGTSSSL